MTGMKEQGGEIALMRLGRSNNLPFPVHSVIKPTLSTMFFWKEHPKAGLGSSLTQQGETWKMEAVWNLEGKEGLDIFAEAASPREQALKTI